jgi:hypothetical protein
MDILYKDEAERREVQAVMNELLLNGRTLHEAVSKKRSWSASQKAIARATYLRRIHVAETILQATKGQA